METVDLDLNKRYTFADYLGWFDNKRRELINGFVNLMTPAPSTKHQLISGAIHGQLWQQLKNDKCNVFAAPFDVRFPSKKKGIADNEICTVVQPDICIVCDESKIDEKGCIGAPDLIVEIISHSSVKRDVEDKFKLYQENGVNEYWIIHPNDETLTVFILEKNKYKHKGIYTVGSTVDVGVFAIKISIDLNHVFK